MTRLTNPALAAASLLFMVLSPAAASAACFESGVGCPADHAIPRSVLKTLSCDALWTVRNTIYHEHGYCFRTARGRDVFSNDGCSVTDAADLDFNGFEQSNINRIVAVERQKGCR